MAKTHTVEQGEHLSALAEEQGFGNFHTIFDRAENAELKKLRDPHTLFPGDRVFIPDATQRTEVRATDAVHVFQADVPKLFARVKLLDVDGVALKTTPCDVTLPPDDEPVEQPTDGNGVLERQIPRARRQTGRVVAHAKVTKPAAGEAPVRDIGYDLVIGALNPHDKLSGQQARLSNLGYFAGYTVRDVDALIWAAEEFLCDQVVKARLKEGQRPPIKPAPPAEGADKPDPATADDPTGIDDPGLARRLRDAHGV
jgi:hypothetical protein